MGDRELPVPGLGLLVQALGQAGLEVGQLVVHHRPDPAERRGASRGRNGLPGIGVGWGWLRLVHHRLRGLRGNDLAVGADSRKGTDGNGAWFRGDHDHRRGEVGCNDVPAGGEDDDDGDTSNEEDGRCRERDPFQKVTSTSTSPSLPAPAGMSLAR